MDIQRAKEIVRLLANGVDPTTGEVFAANSVYNTPDVIRALYIVLEELNKSVSDPLRNAGKPWTDIEDAKLEDEFACKMRIADIAREHGRSYGAIESRLDYLGLKKKPFWRFKRNKG